MTGQEQAPAAFVDVDLRGARFVRADLSGAVLRGVDVQGMDLDAPWLSEDGGSLLVNGVDVAPLVEAELDRRFPGRSERRATTPEGLRSAWAAVERTWTATVARAEALPQGSVDVEVEGEWSFAQTLRHLVMATDTWLGRGVLGLSLQEATHPLGVPNAEYAADGHDISVFATRTPSWGDVLQARAERVAMVRDFLADLTPERLTVRCRHPWDPASTVSTLHCLHVVLHEEWEHHRYAVRDLAALQPD